MSKLKKINIKIVIILMLTLVFFIHNILIVISSGPTNPLSAKYSNLAKTYTSSIFSQNWHLFAPDPIRNNVNLYIQVSNNPSNTDSSEWLNISPPLNEAGKKMFSPFNRTSRLVSGIFLDMRGENLADDLFYKYVEEKNRSAPEDPINKLYERKKKETRKIAEEHLFKFVSFYIKKYTSTDKTYFRVRIISKDTVPFSKRNTKDYEPKTLHSETTEWNKISEYY
ncbi:DUF5819 family protein [Bacillus safensis]|uniref:DUF5819 family protein n=1 Tax=Bacillus safensis TaxID=561879 RepID=UPI00344E2583